MAQDDWKTLRIRAAEAELDLALATLDTTIAEADARVAALPETTVTDRDIEQIAAHHRAPGATPAERALQARIDAGELSWRDILSGRSAAEPGVREALEAGVPQLRQAYTLLQEGHPLTEVIAAGIPPEDDNPDDFGGPILRKR
ncbi:hypothetical protein [Actinokineospora bangkokensis]|uniref:Uncharacterized protein n=1 Tax=Actinokineospora bangkokensis TaxID=1193682 RepID=A0A1Q9LFC8_9PSEU|nr:hypothetical protein [Actinokineospora bangkokensis]OLR90720.1 hypothetical protein BJP25_29440 [Actinokineospora bangkokensis]